IVVVLDSDQSEGSQRLAQTDLSAAFADVADLAVKNLHDSSQHRDDSRMAEVMAFGLSQIYGNRRHAAMFGVPERDCHRPCLLYTSDAADERSSVDLGGRRIIKKK